MSFNNSGLNPPQYYNNIGANIAVKSASMPSVNKISLNARENIKNTNSISSGILKFENLFKK